MLLDDLATWVAASGLASSSGADGWWLWRSRLASAPDRAVGLVETGGDPQLPNVNLDRPTFRALVRGARLSQVSTAYREARIRMQDVRNRLHFVVAQEINGSHYNAIIATQEPMYRGEDENQRPVFSCDFRVVKESS